MQKQVFKSTIFLGVLAILAGGCDTGSRGSGSAPGDVDLTVPSFSAGFVALGALETPTNTPAVGAQAVFPMITIANGGTDPAMAFEVGLVAATGAPMPGPVYDRGRVTGLAGGAMIALAPPPRLAGTPSRVTNPNNLPPPATAMMNSFYKDPGDNYLLMGQLGNELGLRTIDPSNGTAGMFNMGCIADVGGAVVETDESNNIGVDMQAYTFQANNTTADLTPATFLTFDFGGMPAAFNSNFMINMTVANVGALPSGATSIAVLAIDNQGVVAAPLTGPNGVQALGSVGANSQMAITLDANLDQNVMNPVNFVSGSIIQFYVWIDVDLTAPTAMPPGNLFIPGLVNEGNEYNNGQAEFVTFQ